jgi:hypothetical protein
MVLNKLFEVRNSSGQYLATYRAKNAASAIERLKQDDRNTASTFRKSQPATKFQGLTATEKVPQD